MTMSAGSRSSLGSSAGTGNGLASVVVSWAAASDTRAPNISTSEKPGANLVSEAVVTRIDQELGANGALIAVHAQAAAARRARRSPARAPISPSPGAEREEVDQVKRDEFLQLAAGTVIAAAMPRGLASLLADPPAGSDVNAWAAGVHDAVLNPTDHAAPWLDAPTIHPETFRAAIDKAMTASLTAGYHALDTTLPHLIGRAEAQALATPTTMGPPRSRRRLRGRRLGTDQGRPPAHRLDRRTARRPRRRTSP